MVDLTLRQVQGVWVTDSGCMGGFDVTQELRLITLHGEPVEPFVLLTPYPSTASRSGCME